MRVIGYTQHRRTLVQDAGTYVGALTCDECGVELCSHESVTCLARAAFAPHPAYAYVCRGLRTLHAHAIFSSNISSTKYHQS